MISTYNIHEFFFSSFNGNFPYLVSKLTCFERFSNFTAYNYEEDRRKRKNTNDWIQKKT